MEKESGRVALPALIQENASLRRFNTFGVDATARWLVRLRLPSALPEILTRKEWKELPILVMGDGSNILFRKGFDGLVIKLDCQRVEQVGADDHGIVIRAEAGRNWHGFVNWTLEHNLAGLENLSLIPGTVGAAPIQNIGAYGVELDRLVEAVEVFDRDTGTFADFTPQQCGFGYRTSHFKRDDWQRRFVVCAVRFRFSYEPELVLHYPGVKEELAALGVAVPGAQEVAQAICNIRRRRLPDPAVLGNAGSFFKNPVVPERQAESLAREFPDLPIYPHREGGKKLSAAWMIDHLGYKGYRDGDAGVSDTHALVIVNHGNATGEQIFEVAEKIHGAVEKRFGVALDPEPLII
jgi:UDP-N-acetylmuramate dehydrogenase